MARPTSASESTGEPSAASVRFADQTVTAAETSVGATDVSAAVTLSRASLPEEAVIALLALDAPLPDAVVGHVGPLAPGEHRTLDVPLDGALGERRTVVAVVLGHDAAEASQPRRRPVALDGLDARWRCWLASDVAQIRPAGDVERAIAAFVA